MKSILYLFLFIPLISFSNTIQQEVTCGIPTVLTEILSKPAPIIKYDDSDRSSDMTITDHEGVYKSSQRILINADGKKLKSIGINYKTGYCITNLYISYAINHFIAIKNEVPFESCAYQNILAHERVHERIHIEQAEKASSYLKAKITETPLYFPGDSGEFDAQKWILQMNKYVDDTYKQFILPAQKEFDSPQEYNRLKYMCSNN